MLRVLCAVLAAKLLLVCGVADARPVPESFAGLAQTLSPAVVNIAAEKPRAADGREARSLGSGFVIDVSGLIVTNNHVVEGASAIYVGFADGSRRAAKIAGRDKKSDIALLRVDPDKVLTAVSFGDSDLARAGDWVLAIGNPFGLGGSVSAGIISARNRQLDSEHYDDFIQTDAAINQGSSGGALFDIEGRVVGVTSSLISPSGGSVGVSFAIPANTVKVIVMQLRKFGEVRRGWIGANVQDLTPDLAEGFDLASAHGALVGHVTPGGPAALAGLAPGDIVTRIEAQSIVDARLMQKRIAEAPSGKVLAFGVLRKGSLQQFNIRVARRVENTERAVGVGAAPRQPESSLMLGLGVEALTSEQRRRSGFGTALDGVVVSGVAPGSSAAEAGVIKGDVIVEVAQNRVRSPVELKAQIVAARVKKLRVVLVALNRSGEMVFKALRVQSRRFDAPLKTAGR